VLDLLRALRAADRERSKRRLAYERRPKRVSFTTWQILRSSGEDVSSDRNGIG